MVIFIHFMFSLTKKFYGTHQQPIREQKKIVEKKKFVLYKKTKIRKKSRWVGIQTIFVKDKRFSFNIKQFSFNTNNFRLRHVLLKILGHSKTFELLLADDLLQFLVADGPLLILGILEFVFFNISPHLFNDLMPRGLIHPNNGLQISGKFVRLGESCILLFL